MQSMNAINAPRNGSMLPGIWLLKWKTPQRIIGVRGGHTKRKQGRTNALPDMRIDYRKDHALMDLHSIFDPRSSILDPRSSILDPRSSILEVYYSGILPCFRGGLVSRLFSNSFNARISFWRVNLGSITSSMKPRSAATYS